MDRPHKIPPSQTLDLPFIIKLITMQREDSMRFWRKKTETIVPARVTREQLHQQREHLAEQVVKDLREQQIGLQPDYPVKPVRDIDESVVLARLGVPPKRYYIADTAEIQELAPRIKATLPDEQEMLDNIEQVKRLGEQFFGDNE